MKNPALTGGVFSCVNYYGLKMQASFFCTILAIFSLSSIFNKIDNRYKAPEKTKSYKNSQQQLK